MSNKWESLRSRVREGFQSYSDDEVLALLDERDKLERIVDVLKKEIERGDYIPSLMNRQQRAIEVMRRHCVDTTLRRVERILKGEE